MSLIRRPDIRVFETNCECGSEEVSTCICSEKERFLQFSGTASGWMSIADFLEVADKLRDN